MKVRPTDVVSGTFYLKLMDDYREYDRKQKVIIQDLKKRIEFLEWQIEDLRMEIEESGEKSHEKLRKKLHNQRLTIQSFSDSMAKLRKETEELKAENKELFSIIIRLRKDQLESGNDNQNL